MSEMDEYNARRQERIAEAMDVIQSLFTKYRIRDLRTASREVEDRFTQDDFDQYRAARKLLTNEGAI